jgi:hypothetical protein
MDENLLPRIGTFFILVGLGLLILFVGSAISKDSHGIYLLLSLAAILVGFLFRRNRQVKESGRFGFIHRAKERNRQRRKERMNYRQRGGIPPGRRRHMPASGSENEEEDNQEEQTNE